FVIAVVGRRLRPGQRRGADRDVGVESADRVASPEAVDRGRVIGQSPGRPDGDPSGAPRAVRGAAHRVADGLTHHRRAGDDHTRDQQTRRGDPYWRAAGVDTLVLDDQEDAGGAWRHVWPSMTLFSTAEFSSLPGKPMPAYEGFPPSDHVIDYLADYEQRYRIPVERPVHVDRVEREDGGYRLHAGDRSWTAPHVVAATGTWSTPFVPAYPGLFTGTQWHSANYPGVGPFRGSSVAVVGAANSAAQIAAELTGVAE